MLVGRDEPIHILSSDPILIHHTNIRALFFLSVIIDIINPIIKINVGSVRFWKPQIHCNFLWVKFPVLYCDNIVLMRWLGLGTNNTTWHVVLVLVATKHGCKLSQGLLKNIQWFHAYRF